MQEEPLKKRAKSKPPKAESSKSKFYALPPALIAPEASFYRDPKKPYVRGDEGTREEIQCMMNTWGHYSTAVQKYESIYQKTSDDYRGLRECHEKIAPSYAEGQIFQLAIDHYIRALKCGIAIPKNGRTQDDLKAVARIFGLLITALNGLVSRFSINAEKVKEYIDFCVQNSAELNYQQREPLTLGSVDVSALEAHTKYPWGKEISEAASALIKLVKQDVVQDEPKKAKPHPPRQGRK